MVHKSSNHLEIQLSNPEGEVHWVKGFNVVGGGSMTQYLTPQAFVPNYGAAPVSVELHLRVNFVKGQNRTR